MAQGGKPHSSISELCAVFGSREDNEISISSVQMLSSLVEIYIWLTRRERQSLDFRTSVAEVFEHNMSYRPEQSGLQLCGETDPLVDKSF